MRSELNRGSPFREAELDLANQEPRALHKPMPVSTYVFLAVGLFWAMNHLDNYAGGFNPRVYQRFTSTKDLAGVIVYDPEREVLNRGLDVYSRLACIACHQSNGQGSPGQFPPLAGSEWVAVEDPGRLIRIVLDGLNGPISVKGQSFNGSMPGWRALSDAQIAHVLTFVRKSWGNDAKPVTPSDVSAIRIQTEERGSAWTAEELNKIQERP